MSESDTKSSESVDPPTTTLVDMNSLKPVDVVVDVVVQVSPSNHPPSSSNYIPLVISQALELLIKDPNFIKNLETSVKNILKDGKIDQYDIPELVFMITDAYNSMQSIRLEYRDLPVLIKLVYNYMVEKLDLIPSDKRAEFERLVDSALKLVMLQPAISRGVNSCLGKLFSCCGSSGTQ
jgi:hypothetical protein